MSAFLRHITSADGLAEPTAPYSTAVVAGATCYVSGQVALGPHGRLSAGDVRHEAEVALDNMALALEAAGFGVADVATVTVLLADIADFGAFNEVYAAWWEGRDLPARMAYQAGALPLGARVEVQCTAVRER